MKSTEVQTSPMLASGAQLLACGIYTCVSGAKCYQIWLKLVLFLRSLGEISPYTWIFPRTDRNLIIKLTHYSYRFPPRTTTEVTARPNL